MGKYKLKEEIILDLELDKNDNKLKDKDKKEYNVEDYELLEDMSFNMALKELIQGNKVHIVEKDFYLDYQNGMIVKRRKVLEVSNYASEVIEYYMPDLDEVKSVKWVLWTQEPTIININVPDLNGLIVNGGGDTIVDDGTGIIEITLPEIGLPQETKEAEKAK